MSAQIIRTPSGDEMVVIPRAEYDALIAGHDPEDAADIAMFDRRMEELSGKADMTLPADVSALLLKGNTRLKALRKWRGLSQVELAARAGVGQGYISEIESGRKAGAHETLDAIATALEIPREWIA